MDRPTENPASKALQDCCVLTYCWVTMEMKSTSHCIATDMCWLMLMWEVSPHIFLASLFNRFNPKKPPQDKLDRGLPAPQNRSQSTGEEKCFPPRQGTQTGLPIAWKHLYWLSRQTCIWMTCIPVNVISGIEILDDMKLTFRLVCSNVWNVCRARKGRRFDVCCQIYNKDYLPRGNSAALVVADQKSSAAC
jgi:hypothetical protein